MAHRARAERQRAPPARRAELAAKARCLRVAWQSEAALLAPSCRREVSRRPQEPEAVPQLGRSAEPPALARVAPPQPAARRVPEWGAARRRRQRSPPSDARPAATPRP